MTDPTFRTALRELIASARANPHWPAEQNDLPGQYMVEALYDQVVQERDEAIRMRDFHDMTAESLARHSDALRAERDALVPLARLGLQLLDESRADPDSDGDVEVVALQIGGITQSLRNPFRHEETELTKQARALLAARKGVGYGKLAQS